MAATFPEDKSNGYEQVAETFIRVRNPRIGPGTVLEWSRTLQPGSSILDLGCGCGVPISRALIQEGFSLYGVDASAKMISAFLERFPQAHAECAAVEDSEFFGCTFDGIVAWGLLFLLTTDVQRRVIHKAAKALKPSGEFLFTATERAVTWSDGLTGLTSVSLGAEMYKQILRDEGLILVDEAVDQGDNPYYFSSKS